MASACFIIKNHAVFCHLFRNSLMFREPACVSDVCMQSEANKIKKEAEELDQLIARKLKDYEDLREDMKGKELEVKNLLEKGKTEQQVSSVCCRQNNPKGNK